MSYWAGLNLKEYKELLEAGVNTMFQIALKLLNKKMKTDTILLLKDDSENSQKD
jgi:ArsR family metal-binding transcriptional regulator